MRADGALHWRPCATFCHRLVAAAAAGGYTSDWYDHKPVTEGRLDARWLLVPAGLVALVVAAPLTLAGAARVRRHG